MKTFVLFIMALVTSFAWADTSYRDWRVAEETDAILQVPVCRAYTQVSSNLPVPVELSLSFPTAFDHAPMMVLKLPAASAIDRAVVPLNAKNHQDFLIFQSVTDPAQKDLLWYVPVQMEKLVDIIIGDNYLPLKFSLGGKEVTGRLSLSGSSKALGQIARCLKVNDILPTKFFQELNTAAGQAPLGPDQSVAQLMKYVDDAFSVYRNNAQTEDDLAKLRATMTALLKQETDAQRALAGAQSDLDRATTAWQATSDKIAFGERRLSEIPDEIRQLEAQKPGAEQRYHDKKAAYDPLRQAADRYENSIDGYRRDVDTYTSAVSSREQLIRENSSRIGDLQREADQLGRRVNDLDRQIGPLERRKADLESQLASYNVEFERQKILNANSRYQSLKTDRDQMSREMRQKRNELQNAQQRLRQAESVLQQCRSHTTEPRCDREQSNVASARAEVQRAEDALRNCRSHTETPRCDSERSQVQQAQQRVQAAQNDLRRCEGGHGGGHGGRDRDDDHKDKPGKPKPPPPSCDSERAALQQAQNDLRSAQQSLRQCESNRPVPRCDSEEADARRARANLNQAENALRQCKSNVEVPACENEQRQVASAQNDVRRLQSEVNQLESRLNSVESEINRIEADAQNRAMQGREELANQLRRVASELADRRNERDRAVSRMRDINNFEIPRLQQDLSRAQGELPGLRRQLQDAERDLSNTRSDYENWRSSVEYDRVRSEYLDAKSSYDGILSGIESRQSEQTRLNRDLPGWRQQLTKQAAEVQRLTSVRDAAKSKLDGIEAQLAPLRDKESQFKQVLDQLKIQYDELRKLYQTLANQLLGP